MEMPPAYDGVATRPPVAVRDGVLGDDGRRGGCTGHTTTARDEALVMATPIAAADPPLVRPRCVDKRLKRSV